MVHLPAIQDRIILISRALVHEAFTQHIIMEGLSGDVPLAGEPLSEAGYSYKCTLTY